MLSADSCAVSRSMSSISMNWARIASSLGRLICCWPPNRPPNIIIATPPIMKIGKIEPAPTNTREPLAKVMATMPTSRPTTSDADHDQPPGFALRRRNAQRRRQDDVLRLDYRRLLRGRPGKSTFHFGTANSAGDISVGRVSCRTNASARDSVGPGASSRSATQGAGLGLSCQAQCRARLAAVVDAETDTGI